MGYRKIWERLKKRYEFAKMLEQVTLFVAPGLVVGIFGSDTSFWWSIGVLAVWIALAGLSYFSRLKFYFELKYFEEDFDSQIRQDKIERRHGKGPG